MSKVSRDYKNIIKQLNDCRDGCEQMSADGMDVLQEAADIIADYEAMAKHNREMIEKYEKRTARNQEGHGLLSVPCLRKENLSKPHALPLVRKETGWDR